jgi:hypothetical protein
VVLGIYEDQVRLEIRDLSFREGSGAHNDYLVAWVTETGGGSP